MGTEKIIQGGMGIGVSNWILAKAVASCGQMGVVSGTAIDAVIVRRLQDGDQDGSVRFAMGHFPDQEFAEETLKKYFISGGKAANVPYKALPMISARPTRERQMILVLANFVEVFLAKQGHSGRIGVNFLEKIQLPILPGLYGAILAGVDYVLMGAGIPREVPGVLTKLSNHEDVEYKLAVNGAGAEDHFKLGFSPREIMGGNCPAVFRPKFLGIISSTVLALTLTKKVSPPVDGFVIEAPTAGGHNAPPRGKHQFNDRGEPLYGVRDEVDFKVVADLGLPFWLAGSRGSADGLREALKVGAAGIQVGTGFALCNESGLARSLKDKVIDAAIGKRLDIFTDPIASPTGFPFKVARLEGTHSEKSVYEQRIRNCDLGYLREPYKKEDGTLGYRCASEPVDHFLKKGGTVEETAGKKCLCNGLMASIGHGQITHGIAENQIVTTGDDAVHVQQFLRPGARSYSAADVIAVLLDEKHARVETPATVSKVQFTNRDAGFEKVVL